MEAMEVRKWREQRKVYWLQWLLMSCGIEFTRAFRRYAKQVLQVLGVEGFFVSDPSLPRL